jgi:hypothetical protein
VKGLRKQLNDWSKKGEPHLLTGRMRPIDQRTATRGWLETLRANPRTADQDPTGPSTAPRRLKLGRTSISMSWSPNAPASTPCGNALGA